MLFTRWSLLEMLSTSVQEFLAFLSNFTNLCQLFLTSELDISITGWTKTAMDMRQRFSNVLGQCYPSGIRGGNGWPRLVGYQSKDITELTLAADNMNGLHHGNPATPENFMWKELIQLSPPQLQRVEVFPMVHIDLELEWLCKRVPTD